MTGNFIAGLGAGVLPWYVVAIAAVCAYFLGNVNPAILIGKAKGIDIRAQGSGNAGATNALRSLGKKAGAATFAIDVVKGWAGFIVPYALCHKESLPLGLLCGLCVVLGHMYPAAFGFRGGKGVSTTFGVLLAASWEYALVLLAVVVLFTAIFRRVSLSVMIAVAVALALVFGGWPQADNFLYFIGFMRFNAFMPLWMTILLALVVWKHRANIGRLVKGQEPKLSFGSAKKGK